MKSAMKKIGAYDDIMEDGQYIAHCGAWHRLENIPWTCPLCGWQFVIKHAPQ